MRELEYDIKRPLVLCVFHAGRQISFNEFVHCIGRSTGRDFLDLAREGLSRADAGWLEAFSKAGRG